MPRTASVGCELAALAAYSTIPLLTASSQRSSRRPTSRKTLARLGRGRSARRLCLEERKCFQFTGALGVENQRCWNAILTGTSGAQHQRRMPAADCLVARTKSTISSVSVQMRRHHRFADQHASRIRRAFFTICRAATLRCSQNPPVTPIKAVRLAKHGEISDAMVPRTACPPRSRRLAPRQTPCPTAASDRTRVGISATSRGACGGRARLTDARRCGGR